MSHISRYKTLVSDIEALKSVLRSRNIDFQENRQTSFYGSQKAETVLGFRLPGWKYDCGVNEKGEILYDHWGSDANTMHHLGSLCQAYNEKVITNEAWGSGVSNLYREELEGNAVRLVLEY